MWCFYRKKLVLWVICLLSILTVSSCGVPEFNGSTDQFDLVSNIVGDTYVIQVHLPKEYLDSSESYDVVYQLDGGDQSEIVAGFAQEKKIPIVVVGISYENGFDNDRRLRDFTPTQDSTYDKKNGGGDTFFKFLQMELIPKIDSEYRVKTDGRTLMGHSLAGLAAFYFALTQDYANNKVFSSIAAISPSLWWNSGVLFEMEKNRSDSQSDFPIELFVAAGEMEDVVINGYYKEMIGRITQRNYPSLKLTAKEYDNADHFNSWYVAYPDALEKFYGQ